MRKNLNYQGVDDNKSRGIIQGAIDVLICSKMAIFEEGNIMRMSDDYLALST